MDELPNPNNGMVEQGGGILAIVSPPGSDLNASQAPRIIATSVVLIVLSTVAVVLRFLARYLSRAGLWWDDWTILMALILSWGACIAMLTATTHGFGKHASSIPNFADRLTDAQTWFELFYIYETMYTIAVALTKFSILLFYSRIFTERKFRIALGITFAVVTLWLLAIEITVLAECVPISGLWDLTVTSRCIEIVPFFLGAGIPNVLLNVIIVCLPLPMIWTLEVERKHRWALSAVFGLGAFVIGVSIARVVVLSQIPQEDITWTYVDAGIWTSVEPSIAVVSACLPILRSLWVWRKRRTDNRSTNTVKTHARSPIQSLRPFSGKVDKRRTGSFTSRYPINELPGDNEQGWGTHTHIYSPYSQHSRKTSEHYDLDIGLSELPIQKHGRSSTDKSRARTPSDMDGKRIPELYG